MIIRNNYCNEFMILFVKVCITLISIILSLIIFNLLLVFKISFLFVEIYEKISQLKPVYI